MSTARERLQKKQATELQKQLNRQKAALRALYAFEYTQCQGRTTAHLVTRARYLWRMVNDENADQESIDFRTREAQLGAILDYMRDEGIEPEGEQG